MPKKLAAYDFSTSNSDRDWPKLMDGSPWAFVQGEDFDCKLESMASLARSAAKRHGRTVQVGIDRKTKTVVVQFSVPSTSAADAKPSVAKPAGVPKKPRAASKPASA